MERLTHGHGDVRKGLDWARRRPYLLLLAPSSAIWA
jgi:hypothetical protein